VSLFLDPVAQAMAEAARIGADRVELYTEPYAAAFGTPSEEGVVERYVEAAAAARACGLGMNAGHDLNQQNLARLVAAIPDLAEVSIGHALTAEALEDGFARTVRSYLRILGAAPAVPV
jgi:pyridoxine 5-phosphate synthase